VIVHTIWAVVLFNSENRGINITLTKGNVNFCHHLASVVCRLSSVNFSHFNLLWNPLAKRTEPLVQLYYVYWKTSKRPILLKHCSPFVTMLSIDVLILLHCHLNCKLKWSFLVRNDIKHILNAENIGFRNKSCNFKIASAKKLGK
jgi:hypothetical protein